MIDSPLVTIRGGGELGSAVAHAFAACGARVLVLDRPLPTSLRLSVAFAAAAVQGRVTIQGISAVRCAHLDELEAAWTRGEVAVWTGAPPGLRPRVLVDARMRSLTEPLARLDEADLTIGIGPGLEAGRDVHWVIESKRGPRLGEAIAVGSAERYTGIPGVVQGHSEERILRAPRAGHVERVLTLGDFVEEGDLVAKVDGEPVRARIAGMVRGLKLDGVSVGVGHKLGDVDPRRDRTLLGAMTDKARAVARGALRAAVAAAVLPPDVLDAHASCHAAAAGLKL